MPIDREQYRAYKERTSWTGWLPLHADVSLLEVRDRGLRTDDPALFDSAYRNLTERRWDAALRSLQLPTAPKPHSLKWRTVATLADELTYSFLDSSPGRGQFFRPDGVIVGRCRCELLLLVIDGDLAAAARAEQGSTGPVGCRRHHEAYEADQKAPR
ncbi:hypothetical protein [Streptomyces sp. NPDC085665]|uniref:hypothetical protein n=1 Tax=Streptomyces sp. NPDC085665 TaxID=3365735 RepID=UPI0037D8EBC6